MWIFYENRHKIRKKSVYLRKYHIINVMNDIAQKSNIQIGYYNREKILRIFRLIDQISPEVNIGRKRMISVNYILKQLFDILGIEYKFIPPTNSKKTFNYYSQWWAQIYDLIKEDIKGGMSPHTHARANENKLEKVGPSFSSSVGDFGRLFPSV